MRKILLFLIPVVLYARVETKAFKDGLLLTYTYNEKDLLDSIIASDDSLYHTFTYDRDGHLLEATDHKSNITIRRHLSENGKVLREIFNSYFIIQKGFNDQGNLKSLTIHDKGKVFFKYKEGILKRAIRVAPTGKKLYVHNFDTYNSDGKLLLETMIFNLGQIAYEWSVHKRIQTITSPFFNQKCMYNRRGELINTTVDGHSTHYVYFTPPDIYLESSRDHLICFPDREDLPRDYTPRYDRLGRLIEANTETTKIVFTYDPLGRRLSKKTYHLDHPISHKIEEEHYLYDGNTHIATIDNNGNLTAFRILSPDPKNPKAIAIELNGKTYAPISDIHGRIRTLVDPGTKSVTQTYDYSYFGKQIFLEGPTPCPFLPQT